MAIISKLVVASTCLFSLAFAIPMHKRDYVIDIVTETDYVTVDVTQTVLINAATPTASALVSSTPALTFTSATSTYIAPTTSAAKVAIASSVTPAPVVLATSITSTVAPASTSTPSVVGKDVPAGSITADCEGEADVCVGDVTYYDGGLGACGTEIDTNSDYVIALPYEFMGTLSNTNPYCGRAVTLYNPTSGTTLQATVEDKCMGCVDRAIDLTEVLFNAITDDLGNGRMSGIEWWFT